MDVTSARRLSALGAALLSAGATGFLYGGASAAPSRLAAVAWAGLALVGILLLAVARRFPDEESWLDGAAIVLAGLFVTSLWARPYFHLSGGAILRTAPFVLVFGWLVARWVLVAPSGRAWTLVVVAQIALVLAFFDFTEGALPTRDDHPAFLYRFHLLVENFPRLVFYSPDWNGGYLAYEIPATGALGPFLLAAPLFWTLGAQGTFALLIPYLFVGLVPWIFWLAMRALGRSPAAASLGALLAFAPTGAIFLYELRYGVYPFVLSSLFAVAAAALFVRIFLERRGGAVSVVAMITATTFCLFWPLGALMLAPVVGVALFAAPGFRGIEWRRAAVALGALLAINVPWILDLRRYSDSGRFVSEQKSPLLGTGFSVAAAAEALRRIVEEMHPVALALGIAGIAISLRGPKETRRGRALFVVLFAWSFAVAVIGPQVKEQIALERFAVPAAFFAAAVATFAIERLLAREPSWRRTGALALVLAYSFLSVEAAARHLQSRSPYRYEVLSPPLERILATIRKECPKDQRVLVPGFSLHWFGGGHIAALPLLAERSFLGNDYYHRRNYNDVVPTAYRGADRLGEYLALYDVGCILNWQPKWRRELAKMPSLRILREEGDLAVLATDVPASKFLSGAGRVLEDPAGIVVESADAEIVIKYRFVPGLTATAPATIEPFPLQDGSAFIRVRMGGAKRTEIRL